MLSSLVMGEMVIEAMAKASLAVPVLVWVEQETGTDVIL